MTFLNKFAFIASVAAAISALPSAFATTTWTGASDGVAWSDDGNWDNLAPSSSNGAVFSIGGVTALDTDFTIQSLTFSTGIDNTTNILGPGSVLTVNGAITNTTSFTPSIGLVFSTGNANATWDGPLKFNNIVNIGTRQITIVDSVSFNGNLNFDITSTATYGRFLGAGTTTFNGVTIRFGGAYTGGVAGNTFDFTTGSFTGATLDTASLPTLTNGLSWDTTQFISQGILTVVSNVPEPSTWAALAGVVVLGVAASRRRRTAA